MKVIVIIPTFGRKQLLNRVLDHLDGQTRAPDEVIVSAPDETHVLPFKAKKFPISYVFGRQGLCAQRNQAMVRAINRSDIITFFDDDFLPADQYLNRLTKAFHEHPDWAVIMGHAVADGSRNAGYTFEEGLAALRLAEEEEQPPRFADQVGAYGCNMSVRSSQIGDLRFDERLVLYGWQEDIDFSVRIGLYGRNVKSSGLRGVHLGTKSGRTSGVRFGYSQIINPVYLARKGSMSWRHAAKLMWRNIAANLARSLVPEPWIDRKGRLKGNILALVDIARGRISPDRILELN